MTRKCFLSLFTVILLLLSSSALGQDGDYPKVEVFGGFSWLEIDVEGGEDERFNGWHDLPPRTSPPSKLDSEPFEVHSTG